MPIEFTVVLPLDADGSNLVAKVTDPTDADRVAIVQEFAQWAPQAEAIARARADGYKTQEMPATAPTAPATAPTASDEAPVKRTGVLAEANHFEYANDPGAEHPVAPQQAPEVIATGPVEIAVPTSAELPQAPVPPAPVATAPVPPAPVATAPVPPAPVATAPVAPAPQMDAGQAEWVSAITQKVSYLQTVAGGPELVAEMGQMLQLDLTQPHLIPAERLGDVTSYIMTSMGSRGL